MATRQNEDELNTIKSNDCNEFVKIFNFAINLLLNVSLIDNVLLFLAQFCYNCNTKELGLYKALYVRKYSWNIGERHVSAFPNVCIPNIG